MIKDILLKVVESTTKFIMIIMGMLFLAWIISIGLASIISKEKTPIQLKTSLEMELDADNIKEKIDYNS